MARPMALPTAGLEPMRRRMAPPGARTAPAKLTKPTEGPIARRVRPVTASRVALLPVWGCSQAALDQRGHARCWAAAGGASPPKHGPQVLLEGDAQHALSATPRAGARARGPGLELAVDAAAAGAGRWAAVVHSAYLGGLPASCGGCAAEAPRAPGDAHVARRRDGLRLQYSLADGARLRCARPARGPLPCAAPGSGRSRCGGVARPPGQP